MKSLTGFQGKSEARIVGRLLRQLGNARLPCDQGIVGNDLRIGKSPCPIWQRRHRRIGIAIV